MAINKRSDEGRRNQTSAGGVPIKNRYRVQILPFTCDLDFGRRAPGILQDAMRRGDFDGEDARINERGDNAASGLHFHEQHVAPLGYRLRVSEESEPNGFSSWNNDITTFNFISARERCPVL